jgi:DNA-binding NarL/FixJ family response regulator
MILPNGESESGPCCKRERMAGLRSLRRPAAVQKATELSPDFVLLDIGMPIMNGIEAAKRIRQASPASRIIFVTQEDDADIRIAALAIAEGYLLKSNAASELLPAIDAALADATMPAHSFATSEEDHHF